MVQILVERAMYMYRVVASYGIQHMRVEIWVEALVGCSQTDLFITRNAEYNETNTRLTGIRNGQEKSRVCSLKFGREVSETQGAELRALVHD